MSDSIAPATDVEAQDVLFDVEAPIVQVPKRRVASNARPKWTKYRPVNPVKCDDCMLVLALAKGAAPPSRQAKFRRKQGASDLLLCYAHAAARREEDGMEMLDERP